MSRVLGRKKQPEPVMPQVTPAQQQRPGAKNRPTPKRHEAEAARRKPLVSPDRKGAQREERMARRDAMMRGEESALMPRDRGPERRYIRDLVDSRLSVAEVALPVLLVGLLIGTFYTRPVIILSVYAFGLIAILDTAVGGWRAKRKAQAKFGTLPPRSGFYAATRMMQLRMSRVPRPAVKVGDKVS